jgi:hypothetical protein
MAALVRFDKKLRTPATFQIKHRFVIRWLKRHTDKEAEEAVNESSGTVTGPNLRIPHADI